MCLLSHPISPEMHQSGPLFPNFSYKILHQFTFYPKSDKHARECIRHLPINTSSQDITLDLQELRFDVRGVKQMTAKRPSHEGPLVTVSLPPFPATLARYQKSHTLLALWTLSHVAV